MHNFRVWAPIKTKVEVEADGHRHAMVRHADGWWGAAVESAGPGSDYGFLPDGEGPFPDPRSPWQPYGVHGRSRLLDHAAFSWGDGAFRAQPLSAAVIYELHIGTFTPSGTFDAAIERLEHLSQLGVTHIELMPVNEFAGSRGWGYDGVDLFAPHHAYGEPDALKRLVDACHRRGLAVLLDVVCNHLGPSGNYLGRFAPYFTSRYATPWGPALNFDGPYSDEVRRFFCDLALMWLRDYHFDGLRLDAVHAIFDTSAVPFLEQLGAEVQKLAEDLGRPLVLVAESDLNDPRLLWPVARGGLALDAQWSDDFHHALHVVLTGERTGYYADFSGMADLEKAIRQAFVYDGGHSGYRRRKHGRPHGGLGGHRFLAYAQNHDQVGNRACGERLSQLVSPGRLMIAAALVLTSPFVPLLFQGEEWGARTPFLFFSDFSEPTLVQATRDGRQRELAGFGWTAKDIPDPQLRASFRRSKLDWCELSQRLHAQMLEWYRQLIRLRLTEPALRDGRLALVRTHSDEAAGWLVVERGPVSVACNFAAHQQQVPLRAGNHEPLLTSMPPVELTPTYVVLPQESVAILKG